MEYEDIVQLIRDLEDLAKEKMEEVLPSGVSIEDFEGGVDFDEAQNEIVRKLKIEISEEGFFEHGRAWFIDTSHLPNARQDLQIIFLWKDLPIEGNFGGYEFEMMPDLKDLLDEDPDARIFRDIEVRIVDNATADMYLRTGYGPNTLSGLLRDSKEPLFDLKVGDMSELQESKIFGSGSTIGEQIDEVLPMDYQPGKTTLNMPGPSGEVGSVSSAFSGDTPFVTQDVLDNMVDFDKLIEDAGKPNTSTVDDLKLFKMIRDSEVEGIEGLEEIAGIHTETEIAEEIEGVDIPDTPEGAAKDIVPDDISGLDTPTNVVDDVRLSKHSDRIRQIARDYHKIMGYSDPEFKPATVFNDEIGVAASDVFEKLPMFDENAIPYYRKFIQETNMQYQLLLDSGVQFEIVDENPYTPNRAGHQQMIADMENGVLKVLNTESGFGDEATSKLNPMLAESKYTDVNGRVMLENDVFRAVHDTFGHGMRGNTFGPIGEYNAWLAHKEMYSSDARRVMTTETLGQNTFTNYGPHMRDADGNLLGKADAGYIKPADRPFASQKVALTPEEIINVAGIDEIAFQNTQLIDNLPIEQVVKDRWKNMVAKRYRNLATPGGALDAVDVWEFGVMGLMMLAIAYKEYDEIPTIFSRTATNMFNSMTAAYNIPPVPLEQYDLDYEFMNRVLETGEKVMPTDILWNKVKEVVKGVGETGTVTGFGYVPTTSEKTDTIDKKPAVQFGVQEEKMFEKEKPKTGKSGGGGEKMNF